MDTNSHIENNFNLNTKPDSEGAFETLDGYCARVVPQLSPDDIRTLEGHVEDFKRDRSATKDERRRRLKMINNVLKTYRLAIQNTETGFAGLLTMKVCGGLLLRTGGSTRVRIGGIARHPSRIVQMPEKFADGLRLARPTRSPR